MGCCSASGKRKLILSPNEMANEKLIINLYIGHKSTHNLIDFDNTTFQVKTVEVDFSSRLVLYDKELLALHRNEKVENSIELMDFYFHSGNIYIREISSHPDLNIWQVVRYQQGSDVFTINKKPFTILDSIKLEYSLQSNPTIEEIQQEDIQFEQQKDSIHSEEQYFCRICFCSGANTDNPLISPCNCAGSMKYTHLKCIQGWLGTHLKCKKNELRIIEYSWKKIECELCKTVYKSQFYYNQKCYFIIDIPRPQSPFIMFKVQIEEKQQGGIVYIVELQDQKSELKIVQYFYYQPNIKGRIPECDIKMKDISVSRTHATLHIDYHNQDNPFTIEDNGSKFGTLFSIPKIKLNSTSEKLLYQTGKNLLSIQSEKKVQSKQSCYKMPMNIPIIQVEQVNDEDIASFITNNEPKGEQEEEIIVKFKKSSKPT